MKFKVIVSGQRVTYFVECAHEWEIPAHLPELARILSVERLDDVPAMREELGRLTAIMCTLRNIVHEQEAARREAAKIDPKAAVHPGGKVGWIPNDGSNG